MKESYKVRHGNASVQQQQKIRLEGKGQKKVNNISEPWERLGERKVAECVQLGTEIMD